MARVVVVAEFPDGQPPARKAPADLARMLRMAYSVTATPLAEPEWAFEVSPADARVLLDGGPFKLVGVPLRFKPAPDRAASAPSAPGPDLAPSSLAPATTAAPAPPPTATPASLYPDRVFIFHDAENCYIPNDDHINGSQLYVEVVKRALTLYMQGMHGRAVPPGAIDVNAVPVRWTLVLRRDPSNPFHVAETTLDQLIVRGVSHVTPVAERRSVDTAINEGLFDVADAYGSHPARGRMLVVLLSSDNDFVAALRRLRNDGFACAAIHRGNVTNSLRDILRIGSYPMDAGCWDDLVRASTGSDSPALRPTHLSLVCERKIHRPVYVFLVHGNKLVELRAAVHNVEGAGAFVVDAYTVGYAHMVSLKLPEDVRLPAATVNAAMRALDNFLINKVVQEPAFDVPGISAEELRADPDVRERGVELNVFVFIPMLSAPSERQPVARAAGRVGAKAESLPGVQLRIPITWTEAEVKQFCLERHNLYVERWVPYDLPPAMQGQPARYRWVGVILDKSLDLQKRARLVDDLVSRPGVPDAAGQVMIQFRRYQPRQPAQAASADVIALPADPADADASSTDRFARVILLTLASPDAAERLAQMREYMQGRSK